MSAERPFTIVVGVDGSGPSMDAVRFAMRIAADARGARIHLCAVLVAAQEMAMHDTSARPARVLDDSFLERARDETRRGGITDAVTQVLHGDPAEELVRAALDLHADLIVLGVRRAGPLHALMAGSLTLRVIDRAPCPVVLSH
jgi:nucleotide-binding universal stress UspA family protein